MIKLFKLAHCVEVSEIGTYPQVQIDWPWDVDYRGERSYIQTPLRGPVRHDIVFPRFTLEKVAKTNDWVGDGGGVGMYYWMISTKLYEIVKTFKMDEHQYFPAPVHTPKGIVDYHLIYFPWPRGDDFIDWEKSTFQRVTASGERTVLQFENSKARNLARDAHEIQIESIVLHPEKMIFDTFRFRSFHSGFYVSERLKNAMEAAGMTGILYEVPEWRPG